MEKGDISDRLVCPICLEIPRHDIVQCRKGHHICSGCRKSLSECPQCRIPFDKEDIRNLAMESLLDAMEFHCPFKEEGCPAKLQRKDLDSHESSCKFSPTTKLFCARNLGWKNCKVAVDDSSVLSHLEEHRPAKNVGSSTFQIGLEYHERCIEEDGATYFDPVMITSLNTPILLRTIMISTGQIVLTCFMFRDTEINDRESFRVKYLIEFEQDTEIEWTGYVQPYRTFEEISNHNSFYITVPFTKKDETGVSTSTQTQPLGRGYNINIKAAIYKSTAPSLKSGVFQKVDISEQLYPPRDRKNSVIVSIDSVCDVCDLDIQRTRYKCLQCPDYDLCSRCMELGHHSQHFFVRIRDISQSRIFYNEFWGPYYRIAQNLNN